MVNPVGRSEACCGATRSTSRRSSSWKTSATLLGTRLWSTLTRSITTRNTLGEQLTQPLLISRLDTKEFYIPHTRTRVYLFATPRGAPHDHLSEKWVATVR